MTNAPSASQAAGVAAPPGDAAAALWTRRVLMLIGTYFVGRVFVRVAVSSTPEMDEAEQLIQTQLWAWGYGPQPPLYTWIQKLVFGALGSNLFALALLKNALLFATCAVTIQAGREMTAHRTGGLIAGIGLFFVPHFVWSSQNDLTHSILAVFFTALTVWCVTCLLKAPRLNHYLWLALLVAGGILSKYNYVAFFVVLAIALALVRDSRRLLFNWRMALALGLAALLVAPHLNWMLHNPELAFRKVAGLHAGAKESLFQSWGRGFSTLAVSLLAYFGPLALVCGLAHKRRPRLGDFWPGRDSALPVRVARCAVTLSVLFFVVAATFFQARFKERWIHPNMFVLPLLLACVQANWRAPVVKRFIGIATVAASLVFLMLPGRVLFAGVTGQPHRQNLPYAELLDGVFAGHRQVPLVLAHPNALAGAVKLRHPAATVVTASEIAAATNATGPILIVWDASERAGSDSMKPLARRFGIPGELLDSAHYVEAPLKYVPQRTRRVGFVFAVRPASEPLTRE